LFYKSRHWITVPFELGRDERAHDLVDLQVLEQEETIDLAAVAKAAERLFSSRGEQPWPPVVAAYDHWDTLYAAAADGLGVIGEVDAAVAWANAFIARVVGATEHARAD
jgi:hypothetical protein